MALGPLLRRAAFMLLFLPVALACLALLPLPLIPPPPPFPSIGPPSSGSGATGWTKSSARSFPSSSGMRPPTWPVMDVGSPAPKTRPDKSQGSRSVMAIFLPCMQRPICWPPSFPFIHPCLSLCSAYLVGRAG